MGQVATKLQTSTSTAALNQRAIETETAAIKLMNESRDRFGKVDVAQIQAKLSKQPGFDRQMLNAVEARLTPVDAGKLARLSAASAAGAAAFPIPMTFAPSSMAQAKLTPVQQGEMERLALTQGGTNASLPPEKLAVTQGFRGFFSDIGDFFTGGNEGGDFFNEIGVPIAISDDPPSPSSSSIPEKKEPIPGDRDPEDDVRPTSSPPNSGSGAGPTPTSPPPNSGSGAGDPGAADPYIEPHQLLVDATHRQLSEEGGETHVSGLFGKTSADKLDTLNSIGEGEVSPWADALNDFKDLTINRTPLEFLEVEARFEKGIIEGVGGGFLDAGKGIAKLAVNAAQFYGDTSIAGAAFDELRGVTGELPKWLDAIIPSQQRGIQTIHYTEQVADNIGAYIGTRAKDPSLLRDDVKEFLSTKWNELKDAHAAARANGPAAEAEWWGKTLGRATFEIATTVTAVGDFAKLAEAGAGIAKLAIEAGVEYSAAKLGEISKYANDMVSAAKTAAASDELSLAGLEDLEAAQKQLREFQLFEADNLPKTSAGQEVINDVEEAEAEVNKAIDKAKRLETPNASATPVGVVSADVELLTNSQNIFDKFDSLSALKEGNSSLIKLDSPIPLSDLSKNLANLTDKYGVEFGVFKRGDDIILIRGDANGIDIPQAFRNSIEKGINKGNKWQLLAHTQPGHDVSSLRASQADQDILKLLDQRNSSAIINSRGQSSLFNQDAKFTPSNVTHINKLTFATESKLYSETNQATKLKPYARYEYNGYKYETDSKGRVVSASGELQINPPNTPRKHTSLQTQIGHEGRPAINGKYPDVGFHLIGHQFKGEINYLNVVPGDAILNGNSAGKYGALENSLAKELENGYRVEVDIQLKYDGAAIEGRPEEFVVRYRTTTAPYSNNWGQWASQTFMNK